jgi:hypothetical protein
LFFQSSPFQKIREKKTLLAQQHTYINNFLSLYLKGLGSLFFACVCAFLWTFSSPFFLGSLNT